LGKILWLYFKPELQTITTNINKEAATINKIIIQSAHLSIPQSSQILHSYKVPWWNKKLTQMHQRKKNAWKTLNRDISQANIISYRRANPLLKRKIKIRKREATIAFTSTIQSNTPTSTIWNNIRRFCGLNQCKKIHCVNNTTNTHEHTLQTNSHNTGLALPQITISTYNSHLTNISQ